jgi:dolichol-phosphate mannosyltransferase
VSHQVAVDRIDVRDRAMVDRFFERVRPDDVINAVRPAGDFRADHEQMYDTVVHGTHNLLGGAARAGCARFVQFGSASEYGQSNRALSELQAPAPETAFGGAKAAATMLCLAAGHSDSLATVVLRPFMVYGPRDVSTRLVPTIIRSALDDSELALTPVGFRRDWVFVRDVADAAVPALSGAADGQVVNLGTGVDRANEELVGIVERLTGRSLRLRVGAIEPRPWDRPSWAADTSCARRLLGWEAATTLEDGLRETLEWAQSMHQAATALEPSR